MLVTVQLAKACLKIHSCNLHAPLCAKVPVSLYAREDFRSSEQFPVSAVFREPFYSQNVSSDNLLHFRIVSIILASYEGDFNGLDGDKTTVYYILPHSQLYKPLSKTYNESVIFPLCSLWLYKNLSYRKKQYETDVCRKEIAGSGFPPDVFMIHIHFRCYSYFLSEHFDEIAHIAESCLSGYLGDAQAGGFQERGGFGQAIFQEVFGDGHVHHSLEIAAAFVSAHGYVFRQSRQGKFFLVVFMQIADHLQNFPGVPGGGAWSGLGGQMIGKQCS